MASAVSPCIKIKSKPCKDGKLFGVCRININRGAGCDCFSCPQIMLTWPFFFPSTAVEFTLDGCFFTHTFPASRNKGRGGEKKSPNCSMFTNRWIIFRTHSDTHTHRENTISHTNKQLQTGNVLLMRMLEREKVWGGLSEKCCLLFLISLAHKKIS